MGLSNLMFSERFELLLTNLEVIIVSYGQLRDIGMVVPDIPNACSEVIPMLHVIEYAFQRAIEHKVCGHAVDMNSVATIQWADKIPGTPREQLSFPMFMHICIGSYKCIRDQLMNDLELIGIGE